MPYLLETSSPLYFSVHSHYAKLAPEGGALVHVMKYLAPEQKGTEDTKDELEGVLDELQPGWRQASNKVRFLPSIVVSNRLDTADSGGFFGRQPTTDHRFPNIYFAGDWVGSQGMLLDASVASAQQCVEQILHDSLTTAGGTHQDHRRRMAQVANQPASPAGGLL